MSLLKLANKLSVKHAQPPATVSSVGSEIQHLHHELGKYIAKHEETWHKEPYIREELMNIYKAMGEVVEFFED
jgi:hypothetical protein